MGAGASSDHRTTQNLANRENSKILKNFIPVEVEPSTRTVEHYMPPTFPIDGKICEEDMKICRDTWKQIIDGTADGMLEYANQGKSGIVLFYDEFFFRLFKRAKIFIDVFPDLAKRGEVLMKMMGFVLRITGSDDPRENTKIYYLGRSHKYKSSVRPWMFSMYTVCVLETLMFCLGSAADGRVGAAWTNLSGYVMRRMLRAYLKERTLPTEFYQNYDIEAVRKIMAQSQHSKFGMSQAQSQAMLSQMSQRETSQHSQVSRREVDSMKLAADQKSVQISNDIEVKQIESARADSEVEDEISAQ